MTFLPWRLSENICHGRVFKMQYLKIECRRKVSVLSFFLFFLWCLEEWETHAAAQENVSLALVRRRSYLCSPGPLTSQQIRPLKEKTLALDDRRLTSSLLPKRLNEFLCDKGNCWELGNTNSRALLLLYQTFIIRSLCVSTLFYIDLTWSYLVFRSFGFYRWEIALNKPRFSCMTMFLYIFILELKISIINIWATGRWP